MVAGAATFTDKACVGVLLATADYPRSSTPLRDLSTDVELAKGRVAFWGASTARGGTVDANGGRVLTVAALGSDLASARANAYAAVAGSSVKCCRGKPRDVRLRIAYRLRLRLRPRPWRVLAVESRTVFERSEASSRFSGAAR
jgi:phosphoribosylamine-glycine ligase